MPRASFPVTPKMPGPKPSGSWPTGALTGMTVDELEALTQQLAPAQAAQTTQRCYQQCRGRRRRASAAGSRPMLSDPAPSTDRRGLPAPRSAQKTASPPRWRRRS